ncbi:hypothetical protein RCL1_006669 [Eukaryota sp. TZLM3-RCL]
MVIPRHVRTDAAAKFYLLKACRIVPVVEQKHCIDWVESNSNTLMEMSENHSLAERFCTAIKFCGAQVPHECTECLSGAHSLRKLIPDDLDPMSFEPLAIAVCQKYHSALGLKAAECKKLAHAVAIEYVNLTSQENFEEALCKELQLCPS